MAHYCWFVGTYGFDMTRRQIWLMQLLELIQIELINSRKVAHLNFLWSDKAAVICAALEVALALDAAIILAQGLIILHSHPMPSWKTLNLANVPGTKRGLSLIITDNLSDPGISSSKPENAYVSFAGAVEPRYCWDRMLPTGAEHNIHLVSNDLRNSAPVLLVPGVQCQFQRQQRSARHLHVSAR